jgi:hypothetical protein
VTNQQGGAAGGSLVDGKDVVGHSELLRVGSSIGEGDEAVKVAWLLLL